MESLHEYEAKCRSDRSQQSTRRSKLFTRTRKKRLTKSSISVETSMRGSPPPGKRVSPWSHRQTTQHPLWEVAIPRSQPPCRTTMITQLTTTSKTMIQSSVMHPTIRMTKLPLHLLRLPQSHRSVDLLPTMFSSNLPSNVVMDEVSVYTEVTEHSWLQFR
jgi:hypothetical protein